MLKGKELNLREIRREDFEELSEVRPSESYFSLVGENPAESLFSDRDLFAGAFEDMLRSKYLWCIIHEGRIIGTAILHQFDSQKGRARFAIGIFHEENWGKGFGSEAGRLVSEFAFGTLGLKELEVRVLENNDRAIRCYQKLGFQVAGELESGFQDGDKWIRDIVMTITRPAR